MRFGLNKLYEHLDLHGSMASLHVRAGREPRRARARCVDFASGTCTPPASSQ